MKEWIPSSKERLQDTPYYGFFWVQKYGSKKPYPVWRSNLPWDVHHVLTHKFEGDLYTIQMDEIEAWYKPSLAPLPEPYASPKPPKDLVGTWMDGATEEPPSIVGPYLIQRKGQSLNYAAEYGGRSQNFRVASIAIARSDVWWLKLEDKEDDGDE